MQIKHAGIRLFDIVNKVVVPSEHCYTITILKRIMEVFDKDEEYLKIYQFLYYLCCPDEDHNPFSNVEEDGKDLFVYNAIDADFDLEDPLIQEGLDFCFKMYDTPTRRAYLGIKTMLDRLGDYMQDTKITHGRDGNITALVNAAAKYQQIRASFKDARKDLKEEQASVHVHGKQKLGYDQM